MLPRGFRTFYFVRFFTFFFLFFSFSFVSFLFSLFCFRFFTFRFFFVSFRYFSPCFLFVFFLSVSFRFFRFSVYMYPWNDLILTLKFCRWGFHISIILQKYYEYVENPLLCIFIITCKVKSRDILYYSKVREHYLKITTIKVVPINWETEINEKKRKENTEKCKKRNEKKKKRNAK